MFTDRWKAYDMWYFAWILGLGLASTFSILNALWFEMREDRRAVEEECVTARRPR